MLFFLVSVIICFCLSTYLYHLNRTTLKWVVLMLLNYSFYYFIAGRWFWPLIAVSMIAYLYSIIQLRWSHAFYLAIGLLFCLIGYLKVYVNVFHPFNLESLGAQSLYGFFHYLIPIGFSIYVLQAIAYIVDVHRGKHQPILSFVEFATISSYFPLLMGGPIVDYHELHQKLKHDRNQFDPSMALEGVLLFMFGLCKKLIIAERLASLIPNIFEYGLTPGTAIATVAIIPVYFFTEYSSLIDIIRGASKVLGVDLPSNYQSPLTQLNFLELLRNWNTTLFYWLKNYLWEPLCALSESLRDKILWLLVIAFAISIWFAEKNKIFILFILLSQGLFIAIGLNVLREKWISIFTSFVFRTIAFVHSLLTYFFISYLWFAPNFSAGVLIIKQILKRDFKMFGSSQFDYLSKDIRFAFYAAIALLVVELFRPQMKRFYKRVPSFFKWTVFGLMLVGLMIFYSNNVATFIFYRM